MQFIGTGDRILTENFVIGYLYTITFKSGNYINTACIGIGDNFVMFQRTEPDLLFTLNVDTADEVDTIELYDSGGGTNNYEELTNKPKINSVELIGNKSLSDLGIQAEITDENPLSSVLVSGLGTAAAADTTDFATAAQGALAASAVQPSDLITALAAKQDVLSAAQLAAVNSGITSTDVAQIETNKNNILTVEDSGGVKNLLPITRDSIKANNPTLNWTGYTINNHGGLTFTFNDDLSITINGTASNSAPEIILCPRAGGTGFLKNGTYTLDGGYSTPTELLIGVNRTVGGSGQRYAAYEGTPVTFTVSDSPNEIGVWIGVNATGKTVTFNNVVVKPMICTSAMWGISHKYQTPTISLAELYQKLKEASVI